MYLFSKKEFHMHDSVLSQTKLCLIPVVSSWLKSSAHTFLLPYIVFDKKRILIETHMTWPFQLAKEF